jgi:hypothetical protein
MSGGFVCGFYPPGVEILPKSFTVTSDVPVGDLRHCKSSRGADDRCLSRAERLKIISLIAAVGMSECSAWINPMLERGGPDEDPRMEQMKC